MRELRFAVGSPTGLQAGIWRAWTRPSGDVYLTPRPPARHFKISLHKSGKWRLAYQGVLADEELAEGRDRAPVKWERPAENLDGTTTAIEILVFSSEVVTPPQLGSDDERIVWFPPPPTGLVFVFRFRLASSGRDLGREHRVRFLGPLDAGAESVWIEPLERYERGYERAYLDEAKRRIAASNVGAFPSALPSQVRTVFIPPSGRFVVDAVVPPV